MGLWFVAYRLRIYGSLQIIDTIRTKNALEKRVDDLELCFDVLNRIQPGERTPVKWTNSKIITIETNMKAFRHAFNLHITNNHFSLYSFDFFFFFSLVIVGVVFIIFSPLFGCR